MVGEVRLLDLMGPESIDTFAKGFLDSGRPLDILVANAGTMAVPLTRDTVDQCALCALSALSPLCSGHVSLVASPSRPNQ